jgi:PKD repeat protein
VVLQAYNTGGYNSTRKTGYITVTGSSGLAAHFSANRTEGTTPLVIQFTDESTGSIQNRAWNFNDGASSSQQNPVHQYNNVGLYWPTLTVTESVTGNTSTYGMPIYALPVIPNGVPIWTGWNFISVPKTLAEGHNTAGDVFANVNMGNPGQPILTYNASIGEWETLGADDELQTLEAYWVYSTQVGPYVTYTYSTDTSPKVPRVKELAKGWNGIGLGSVYWRPVEEELPTMQDNWQVILDFNSALQIFAPPHVKGQTNGWGMEPTKGYWIYLNSPGDLVAMTG